MMKECHIQDQLIQAAHGFKGPSRFWSDQSGTDLSGEHMVKATFVFLEIDSVSWEK